MSASAKPPVFKNPVVRWIDHRLPVFSFMSHELNEYPTPRNLNYMWTFGSLAGIVLVIMILTGIILAMHYTPNSALAFNSVEHIMRDVNYGWLIRYIHMNGASMFFIVVYIHIFRGLYYGSYKAPRELLWLLGIVILILMMATAFMGYVLPWGQMSFWGATVITNLFSAIPLVGQHIVTWLWGGYAVDNPTLNRFFSLHYLLPFVIVAVVMLHLVALHRFGSNNPLGIEATPADKIPFHPYYTSKDAFGLGVFLLIYFGVVFYAPNMLGDPIVTWLWGGFAVDNPTLNRFFALHYLLPFIIVAVVALHVVALHVHGSNNPLGIDPKGPQDTVPFHPYYTIKDGFGLTVFLIVYAAFVFFMPNALGEPVNYVPANPMVTPNEIVPEWYLLPFYAILRAIPDKLAGVIAMFGSIGLLFLLPWLDTSRVRSCTFRPIYKWFVPLLVIDVVVLGYCGAHPPEGYFVPLARVATLYYFFHFLILLPVLGKIERPLPMPPSIADAVLSKKAG